MFPWMNKTTDGGKNGHNKMMLEVPSIINPFISIKNNRLAISSTDFDDIKHGKTLLALLQEETNCFCLQGPS
jgi:hypothetical protein